MFYKKLLDSEKHLRKVFPTIDHNKPYFLCELFDAWSIYYFESGYFYLKKNEDPFSEAYEKYASIEKAGYALLEEKSQNLHDNQTPVVADYGYEFFRVKSGGFKAVNTQLQDGYFDEAESSCIEDLYERVISQHVKNVEVYIHMGFPKCASTTLQEVIFPALKNANYVPKAKFFEYFPYIIDASIQLENELEEYKKRRRYIYLSSAFRKVVFSAEEFTAVRYCKRCLSLTQKLFANSTLIFVVRNIYDYARSSYLQSVQVGYYRKLKQYCFSEEIYLDYASVIYEYSAVLYAPEIVVWRFEQLINQFDCCLGDVGLEYAIKNKQFISVRNPSLSGITFFLAICFNKLTKRWDKFANLSRQPQSIANMYRIRNNINTYFPVSSDLGWFRCVVNKVARKFYPRYVRLREFFFLPAFLSRVDAALIRLKLYKKKNITDKHIKKLVDEKYIQSYRCLVDK